ncbi:MAG: hypothetical protein ACI9R3_001064 [Verrucomicrobiales bacterium]|jgi:hypothetical protein
MAKLNDHRLKTVAFVRTESPVAAEAAVRYADSQLPPNTKPTNFTRSGHHQSSNEILRLRPLLPKIAKAYRLKTVGLDQADGETK